MTYPSVIRTDNSKKVSPLPKDLDRLRLPNHIAVIMDGNGRWAKAKGLPRTIGHTAGVEALKNTLHLCSNWGRGYIFMKRRGLNDPQDLRRKAQN